VGTRPDRRDGDALPDWLTIGELAARSGLSPSALRFYEAEGLISAARTHGNQRRYARATLRRVAFVRAAQEVGLSLEGIRAALASLPEARTPTVEDWTRLSRGFRAELDARIEALSRLRDKLSGCIGCGCLSLRRCQLYNPGDDAAARGPGARYLLGDVPRPAGESGRRLAPRARTQRTERTERTERTGRTERTERTEQTERTERTQRAPDDGRSPE
jgi:MerR family redox-sensitive transcriptional activator SoxR